MSSKQTRRRTLLRQIRIQGGLWPTGRAHALYMALGFGPNRRTAKLDLRYWVRRGVLVEQGPDNGRTYRLAWKDTR